MGGEVNDPAVWLRETSLARAPETASGCLQRVNLMTFGTMLVKLSTFYVPKVEGRATFGSGRNSAKFWRHSVVCGLGSCTPCLFKLYVATCGI